MGNFYVNITTKGADPEDVVNYLKKNQLSAFVVNGPDSFCTIYEEICDDQDTKHISSLLEEITSNYNCPAIGMLNHDDDILAYELWNNGQKIDEYDSCPGYFSGDENRMIPEGGDSNLISQLLCSGNNVVEIEKVLRASGDEGFVFAVERHQALVEAAGLPNHSVGFGFRYISQGELPIGVKSEDIIKTIG